MLNALFKAYFKNKYPLPIIDQRTEEMKEPDKIKWALVSYQDANGNSRSKYIPESLWQKWVESGHAEKIKARYILSDTF